MGGKRRYEKGIVYLTWIKGMKGIRKKVYRLQEKRVLPVSHFTAPDFPHHPIPFISFINVNENRTSVPATTFGTMVALMMAQPNEEVL